MDLLFKRNQASGKLGRVVFELWGKLELDEDEQALVKRYRFDEAILIDALQPKLLRNAGLVGLVATIVAYVVFNALMPNAAATVIALIVGGVAGYWFYHDKREYCLSSTTAPFIIVESPHPQQKELQLCH